MIANCQFFDIFEKLKNDQYEVISAMATAKNLSGRCRPQKSSRESSQKICLRSSTVQEKPLAIAAVSDNEFNFGSECKPSEETITSLVDSSNLRLTVARSLEIYFDEERKVLSLLRFINGKETKLLLQKGRAENVLEYVRDLAFIDNVGFLKGRSMNS